MDEKGQTSREFMFKPRQFLGPPLVTAPKRLDYRQAAVQFIIPGLAIGSAQRAAVLKLCGQLGRDVHGATLKRVTGNTNNLAGTRVDIAFHIPELDSAEALMRSVDDAAIGIVERFLGLLSFLAGMRLVAVHTQTTLVRENGQLSTKLEPLCRSGETRIPLELPENPFEGRTPSENIFIALFWLRRALAERDPLDTYAALMVALQAIARELVPGTTAEKRCVQCGHVTSDAAGVSAMVRQLVVDKLGASPDVFANLWKARNAVVAHGNKAVNAGTFLQLTELKFEAADLCYKGVKLAMGLPMEGPPQLDPSFFVTSALMYVE